MGVDRSVTTEPVASAPVADLVRQATAQISTLIRDELALAKLELVNKGKRAGFGGALLGGGSVLTLYGLGLAIALIVVALDLVWPLWLAVLVVMVAVFVVAAVAALIGRGELQRAAPPVPAEARASLAADVQTVRSAVHEGRQS